MQVQALAMEHWTSLLGSRRGHWSLPKQLACDLLDLEKAFDCIPRGVL